MDQANLPLEDQDSYPIEEKVPILFIEIGGKE